MKTLTKLFMMDLNLRLFALNTNVTGDSDLSIEMKEYYA